MHEILRNLPRESYVLDLGCARGGSFRQEDTAATCVRLDLEVPGQRREGSLFVQADAANLPFPDGTFAAIVSNHSLEHFSRMEHALREIGRVIAPRRGSLFVSVPDASTLTDKLYRWLARGGGHVNAFTSAADLAGNIEKLTGLPHVATRILCSSLSFLNRGNAVRRQPRRLMLLGGGSSWSLLAYSWLSRRLDRVLGWRTSVYGWALYFGDVPEPISTHIWVNVCILCGSGASSFDLTRAGLVLRIPGIGVYRCSHCGSVNCYTDDFEINR